MNKQVLNAPGNEDITENLKVLSPRGPDESRVKRHGRVQLGFTRLAINGTSKKSMQPFSIKDFSLVCNGEIYDHEEWELIYPPRSDSDCHVLVDIFANNLDMPIDILESLQTNEFALCYTDGHKLCAARDPLGVRPLFYTQFGRRGIAFASEAKALLSYGNRIDVFPPGFVYDGEQFIQYYFYEWPRCRVFSKLIRDTFYKCVAKRVRLVHFINITLIHFQCMAYRSEIQIGPWDSYFPEDWTPPSSWEPQENCVSRDWVQKVSEPFLSAFNRATPAPMSLPRLKWSTSSTSASTPWSASLSKRPFFT